MRPGSKLRVGLRYCLLVTVALLLCGCVKFHISINVEPDGSGTVGAALGMTSQAKSFIEGQGIDDPAEEIRGYLIREAGMGDFQEERWIEGDYEWVEFSTPFEDLDDLNNRVLQTEIFESFQLTEESGLVNRTFVLDGVITPDFLLAQVPDDIDVDVTQVIDVRVIVTLPGEIVETSGTRGPRESGTVWWRITSGGPIPLHAVSEMRDSQNVTLLAAGGAVLLVVTAIALALVGFGVYRRRQRREEP